jgi:alkaline phosphatase
MFGGGRCHFLPNSTVDSSCRADDKDVVALAKKNGFSYIDSRRAFDDLKGGAGVKFPMLGLFAETDIPYEIDRRNEDHVYPSLHEMAQTALTALSEATRDSEKGFFLMIEGSRIDHAGHHNDPAAQVHEVLAYDRAFTTVLDFLNNDNTEAVMISTSDHETGGLATARREYLFHKLYTPTLTVSQNSTPPTPSTSGTQGPSPTPRTPPSASHYNTQPTSSPTQATRRNTNFSPIKSKTDSVSTTPLPTRPTIS